MVKLSISGIEDRVTSYVKLYVLGVELLTNFVLSISSLPSGRYLKHMCLRFSFPIANEFIHQWMSEKHF